MAIKPFNSINGFSVSGNGNVIIDSAGNITTDSIIVVQNANLGNIANVKIGGGSNGYVIATDGAGNLSFVAGGGSGNTSVTSPMPTLINSGETYYVTANHQGLYSVPIEINGALEVDGVLVQVDGIVFDGPTGNTEIFYNDNSVVSGSANLTFNKTNSTLTANNFVATTTANLGAVGNVTITGGTSGQYLQTDGSGELSWSTVISGSTSNISNGTSNVSIPVVNGNVNISSAGNANIVVVTGTGANIAGTLSVSGNANIGNIGTALITATGNITGANLITGGNLSVTGNANIGNLGTAQVLASANITTPQFISNVTTGTAPFVVTSTTQVANLSVATAGSATTAGTVTTNDQPNITSTGTLASLSVSGNANIGNIGTSIITATGNIIGANLVTGGIVSATGNGTFGNISTTGSGGNITGANVIFANTISVTANANIGNIGTGGLITATGNINAGNISTAGNVAAGNVLTNNLLYANGVAWSLGGGANIANGTSNVTIATSGGNVTTSVGGTSNVIVVTTTGANVTGYVSATGNVLAGNVLTNNLLYANGSPWAISPGTGTFITRTYTGDGTTTTFTVTSGTTSSSVIVTESGVLQTPTTDYSILGTTLTFTTAPPNGVSIQIRELAVVSTTGATGAFIVNGTSQLSIDVTNSNVNVTVAGVVNTVVFTSTGVNVAGTMSATGNVTGRNLITAGLITATGNITGNYIIGNGSQLTGVVGNARVMGYSLVFGG